MATDQREGKSDILSRPPKLGAEASAAMAGTLLVAVLLALTAMYAGPLWRDEANTANAANLPSVRELWQAESFPPLWTLLLRASERLGLVSGDAGIRMVGLYVGLLFLAALWLATRWMGCRGPVFSVALLGCLPAFIFTVGSNRAYGLACVFLIFSFGAIWRMLEKPSGARVFWAGFASLLFVHCVYFDVLLLAAMLAGGGVVVLRRREWKTLGILTALGVISVASLAAYPSLFHRSANNAQLFEYPSVPWSLLWNVLRDAVTARSSAEFGRNGPEIWLWLALLLAGVAAAFAVQRRGGDEQAVQRRADLAIFCVTTLLLGVPGMFVFLQRLHYLPQAWYFMELLCLCAIATDGLLGASWPALRPWGMIRIGFMIAVMAWGVKSAWSEGHTRRSNLDLMATALTQSASGRDLIVVPVWEGITFNRYYHGQTRWMTVPPIESHLMHRSDLVQEKMNAELNGQEPMAPVLQAITNVLQSNGTVWLIGGVSAQGSKPAAGSNAWLGIYLSYWKGMISTCLMGNAVQQQVLDLRVDAPLCYLEKPALLRFSGYKTSTNNPVAAP